MFPPRLIDLTPRLPSSSWSSGAQQLYRKFGGLDYPYTPRQHLEFALSINADLVATLDLPLDILAPRGLSVREGVRRARLAERPTCP